jgi:hypothetical protein
MVHTAAVSFMVEPMFETTLESHKARKSGRRRGDHAVIEAGYRERFVLPGRMASVAGWTPSKEEEKYE